MTSPSDVLVLARAVIRLAEYSYHGIPACRDCPFKGGAHSADCPVPIAQRVIEEEGK